MIRHLQKNTAQIIESLDQVFPLEIFDTEGFEELVRRDGFIPFSDWAVAYRNTTSFTRANYIKFPTEIQPAFTASFNEQLKRCTEIHGGEKNYDDLELEWMDDVDNEWGLQVKYFRKGSSHSPTFETTKAACIEVIAWYEVGGVPPNEFIERFAIYENPKISDLDKIIEESKTLFEKFLEDFGCFQYLED